VKNGRQSSYTNSRRRSTTRGRASLRWTTTPGGPCSSSCSAPRAVRAHMSMSGSRGNTGIPARSQPPKRCRRWQDIVLSASASIHQTSLRHAVEPRPIFCRQLVSETALAELSTRGGERRRFACSGAMLIPISCSKTELAAVQPHPMHDYRQLARYRDDRALVAALGRDPQPLCFNAAPLLRANQHDASRLVEHGAHLAIPAFGNASFSNSTIGTPSAANSRCSQHDDHAAKPARRRRNPDYDRARG
jgi:hypothetical protein